VRYADFPLESPGVVVHGNVVGATQGKAERDAVLGNGDARAAFQSFKVPRAPLTYLLSGGGGPPEAPELEVWVSGRLWTRVPALFGRGPADAVYVVREDAGGSSWVQFGDGVTGARLPSGAGNVVARYRTGTGAYGALRPDTPVQAGAALDRLDRVLLPGVGAGGAAAESADSARAAAPGTTQSLGRLVSAADFEAEALAIPGVWRASAAWSLRQGTSALVLTVLMETGRDADKLAAYDLSRGMRRFPVVAVPGVLAWVYLAAELAVDPTFRSEAVVAAAHAALGAQGAPAGADPAGGLFWPGARRFGAPEYATRIEAVLQGVPGVAWAAVTGLRVLGPAPDPAALAAPPGAVAADPVLGCAEDRMLALHAAHLRLSPVRAAEAGTPP
jgi:predicted phage baseplate assembly protein